MRSKKTNLLVLAYFLLFSNACGSDRHDTFSGSPSAPVVDSGGTPWAVNDKDSTGTDPKPEVIHNTKYCSVDDQGKVISLDSIQVTDGDRIHGIGGGCISRPIREVWAIIFNYGFMKADEVEEYRTSARPEFINMQKNIFFAYDIENTLHRLGGLITVTWITRWYHTVVNGTYEAPNQIAVNFQKIEGTSHIAYNREGYVLDRVSPRVTSFVVEQTIQGTQVDTKLVDRNIRVVFNKLRSGTPDWAALPARTASKGTL